MKVSRLYIEGLSDERSLTNINKVSLRRLADANTNRLERITDKLWNRLGLGWVI